MRSNLALVALLLTALALTYQRAAPTRQLSVSGISIGLPIGKAFRRTSRLNPSGAQGNLHYFGPGPVTDLGWARHQVMLVKGSQLELNGQPLTSDQSNPETLHQALGMPDQQSPGAEIYSFPDYLLCVRLRTARGKRLCDSFVLAHPKENLRGLLGPVEFCW